VNRSSEGPADSTPRGLATSAFEYELPPDRIASHPAPLRDESRLMVVDRETGSIQHRIFRDIGELIPSGDVVVLNETRVFPARLVGKRTSGGEAEVLLLHPFAGTATSGPGVLWTALVRPGAKLRVGKRIEIGAELSVEIVDVLADGNRVVRLETPLGLEEALFRYGRIPLPPYIERAVEEADAERYQTVYAREAGSVAAPTAGLHFTPALLDGLEGRGVALVRLTLHVGVGTFRPVEVDDPAEHTMHAEYYSVSPFAAQALNAARGSGGRIWAVGTTVARTLETVADGHGVVHAGSGWTDIFIRPPYTFRAVDHLITNFHLPRSTLLMLVASLAGYDLIMRAYREAIASDYRFYSYGDAMAIL
jgi:S-adenosylmethionine:tRNA ribosyltransferase-isomerase